MTDRVEEIVVGGWVSEEASLEEEEMKEEKWRDGGMEGWIRQAPSLYINVSTRRRESITMPTGTVAIYRNEELIKQEASSCVNLFDYRFYH